MISGDYSNLPIAIYEQGTFFGDIEVFRNISRCFSTVALTRLELLAIDKSQFKKIFFREFPSLGHMFLTRFEQKYSSLQQIVELINDFFEPKVKEEAPKVGLLQSFKSNLDRMIELGQTSIANQAPKTSRPVFATSRRFSRSRGRRSDPSRRRSRASSRTGDERFRSTIPRGTRYLATDPKMTTGSTRATKRWFRPATSYAPERAASTSTF